MILTEVTFKQGLEAKQLSSVALGESGRRGSMDNGYKKDFFFLWGGDLHWIFIVVQASLLASHGLSSCSAKV